MPRLVNSLWFDEELPEVAVMTFESRGVQYVNVSLRVGNYTESVTSKLELVFRNTSQIDEIVDALSDARLLLSDEGVTE